MSEKRYKVKTTRTHRITSADGSVTETVTVTETEGKAAKEAAEREVKLMDEVWKKHDAFFADVFGSFKRFFG
jgi:hypothetical protein